MTFADWMRIATLIDTPSIVLLAMLLVTLLWAERAQKAEGFDWAEMFRNSATDKLDWRSLAGIGSFGISAWVLIYAFMNGMRTSDDAAGLVNILHELFWYFLAFITLWGMGPKFVEKIGNAVLAKWSPTTVSTTTLGTSQRTEVTAASSANITTGPGAGAVATETKP